METHEHAYRRFFSRDENGGLVFCGLSAAKVLQSLTDTNRGEPVYLAGTEIIQFQADAAKHALAASRTRPTYAIKANSSPAILEIIRQQGIGAEVASGEELKLALSSGFKPEDIVVDGIGKGEDYFRLALLNNIATINCNDLRELDTLNALVPKVAEELEAWNRDHPKQPPRTIAPPRVGLRISPDIEGGGETQGISTADDSSKFGIKLAEARQAYLSDKYPNLRLVGMHCHLGSNIKDAAKFEAGYGAIATLAEELQRKGRALEYMDFGGGVGVPYTPYGALGLPTSDADKSLLTIEKYGEILNQQRQRLNKINPNLEFISELGRYYVAPAMMYLCKVTGENAKGDYTHITTTGSMGHLIRPAFYKAPHIAFPMVARPHSGTYGKNTRLVGNMCESDDVVVLDCEGLQKQRPGDYVCVPTAGAYNPSMQLGTYNQFGTCGTILVHTDGKAYLTEHPVSGPEYMNLKADGGMMPADLKVDSLAEHGHLTAFARRRNRVYDPATEQTAARA